MQNLFITKTSSLQNISIFPINPKKTTTITMATAENTLTITEKVYVRVRLANEADINHIYKLFYQIHEYHNYTHLYKATESSLCNLLFKNSNPLFYGPSVLLLEVSPTPFSDINKDEKLEPILKTFDLRATVLDKESEEFKSKCGGDKNDVFIAGYAFFFANYSCFYDKAGIYFESLYFRESYRKLGMGRLLFGTVASIAANNGFSSVEGIVAVWNKKSYDFYVDMGVEIFDEFRYGKLVGDALQKYADKEKL